MAADGVMPRSAKYEYRPAANLVLESDRDKRVANEPTGEVESLVGRLTGTRMGDRVARTRPAELDARLDKSRRKRERGAGELEAEAPGARKRERRGDVGFLSELERVEGLSYRPRLKETREVYGSMMALVRGYLGDHPADILAGAAEEVLAQLKEADVREPVRKGRVEAILGPLSEDAFSKLVNMGKSITDWAGGSTAQQAAASAAASAATAGGGALDEDAGVAVILDDEGDEAEDDAMDQVREAGGDEDEEEYGEGEETAAGDGLVTSASGADIAAAAAARRDAEELAAGLVPVHSIDAYWLQRELHAHYSDATVTQKMAGDVMAILSTAFGARRTAPPPEGLHAVENQLVELLDYDKFDLVKRILRNAARVYYVTRLRQAQSEADVASVRAEMAADVAGDGPAILTAVDRTLSSASWAADRTASMTDRMRQEAARLATASSAASAAGARDDGDSAATLPPVLLAAGLASGARTLDLDSLAFTSGGHTMTNKRVELPPKSWRAQKKGYEEVHIPALRPKPFAEGEREVMIADMPAWAQPAFAKMTKLNRVQSRLYDTVLFSAENVLLCAPTGAGKTNVAVLAIMHEVGLHRSEDGSIDTSAFKIVYVAPMKALVQEIVANLSQRLTAAYGVNVRELSGDVNLTKAEITDTQIIVTTPEKWDVITRKAGDRTYTQLVRLLILDEVHLLHDDRGAVLEALVARTLRQVETTQEMVRIVGLSATLPNYEDVATFLRVHPTRGLFHFDASFRPCPLQQQYIGITEKKAVKRFQLMNDITYDKVAEHAGKNQVLVFVHSRKETGKTARALRDAAVAKDALGTFLPEGSASREILVTEAGSAVKDEELKELLPYGFAIHHAGMARADRNLVEELFADGHVQVLVSTATLAWGVNLPAHTVIIKGTQVYSPEKGRWTELSPLDMMQMLGRAGRPQFDTFGEGVIITGHSELQYYLSLLNQQLPIESQLVGRLPDMLNAEVAAGAVTSLREGAAWLGFSYLYVRMLRAGALYGVGAEDRARDPLLLQRRMDLIHTAALALDKHSLVRYDPKTGSLAATALGRVASHYYVSHSTIATYNEFMKPTLGDIELFRLFSLSSEFRNVVIRQEEGDELRKLAERVPVPIKESLEEPSAKVNVLLQAYISNLKLEGFALMSDMVYVHQSAGRLMRAIFEIALRRGWAPLALRALTAAKMIDYRIWQSACPLRQFTPGQGGLTEDLLRRLERKEIAWERYYDLSPTDLGELVRAPKLGKAIHRLVHALPRVDLSAHVQPITRSLLRFDVTIAPDFVFDGKIHGGTEVFWILVEDADGDLILHHETFALKLRYGEEEHRVTFYVPLTEPSPPQYFVRVVSDRWLHSETLLPVSFRALILPDKFPPHTELLDLAPLPVSALHNAAYEALYTSGGDVLGAVGRLRSFNPIQTQAFPALYTTDASVLVAAPSGSGKTICAEFALLRLFATQPDARAVYVAPRPETCRERYEEWEYKFGRGLGKAVVELTGEATADVRLIQRAHVVICTPRQWDVVSRRWKKRKVIAQTALFIADELHAISDDDAGGAVYEVIVSRMRTIAMQSSPPTLRMVGLAMSMANARDVGDWIGASPTTTFNFHPQVRPVPLEIRIQGFDVPHFGARMLAMSRPVYSACVARTGGGKPAIVYAPSRKQAQLTAVDLITYAAADGAPDVFRKGRGAGGAAGAGQDMAADLAAAGIRDAALTTCMTQGVGFYHEGMREHERAFVQAAYEQGRIAVVVATSASTWSMSGARWAAHLVVIMGTESYDGREHKYVDYPLADVLHMMGRASRPVVDATGYCVILCAATRKEYLKKFLYEPLPVESALHGALHDTMNAEVANEVVATKQDALDYLTWTFLYRRLPQNPNFYNLQGVSNTHVADYLSELVDATLSDLEASQCITVTEEVNLGAQSLGVIAAFYYIAYTTLEVFASSVQPKVKTKGLLEIVSMATEYETLPMRHGEDKALQQLAMHVPLTLPPPLEGKAASQFHDTHVKANLLLQAHFSRRGIGGELRVDQGVAVETGVNLVQALVDVISAEGWLKPALAAMELSQMLVQGVWADKDSVLMQVPHMTRDLAARLEGAEEGAGVESVFDLISMEDAVRARLLGMTPTQLADVARFCNRYPSIDMSYALRRGGAAPVAPGDAVAVGVTLVRESNTEGMQEGAGIGAVYAPLYPKPKAEGWWLVIGETATNSILVLKRVTLAARAEVSLEFPAPSSAGHHSLVLYFMSDSYLGCDQEYSFDLHVAGPEEGAEDRMQE